MKKGNSAIIAVVVVIIVIVGGYAIFHKSNKSTSTTGSNSSSAPAVNNSVLITKTDPKLGQYLADPSGKALYTYNSDTNGVSNCTGSCLTTWPAYQDKGSTSGLPSGVSTIKRTDNGQTQYTYNGMPLYYFISDTNGEVNGNGIDSFSIAKPAGASSSSSSSTSPSTSNSSSSSSSSSTYNY